MTETVQRQSATIYKFPPRGRFATEAQHGDVTVSNIAPARLAKAALGSAWYHDEAIREAERPQKK